MKYFSLSILIASAFLAPSIARADTVDLTPVTAKGIAIYGWRNGVPTELDGQYETTPFPIASISKLVTAKAAELLYPDTARFMLTQPMMDTLTGTAGLVPPMTVSRNDLLRVMLITSNNAAAREFSSSIGDQAFLGAMNAVLHAGAYAATDFVNPTGLDPDQRHVQPNSMTADRLSYLLSDTYRNDPLLSSILSQKAATVTDQQAGTAVLIKSTDELNADPLYSQYVVMSKTGTTALAGQSLAFVTGGEGKYDYITVVLLRSRNRYADSKLILDWLQQVLHYTA